MNESEINKLINSMTKKFKNGGFIDCLRNGGSVSKCKCGCDKIAKVQDGRVLGSEQYKHATRKDAIDAAMNQMGFSKQQARLAYRDQKNALRNAGFRGNEMRQHARYNIIDTAYPRAVEEPINTVERVAPLQRMTTVTGGLSSSDPGIIRKTIAPDAE